MDFENDRYSYNGTEYETETAVLAVLGGSKTATNTRIIGPYTFGSNLLTNGDFSDGTTGLGIPNMIIIGKSFMESGNIEIELRRNGEKCFVKADEIVNFFKSK
jgi:hypothetical protein